MKLGLPATIFVPSVTSPAKIERIRSYGAELVIGGDRYADALAASETFVAETGALALHAYDQAETLLGQGTVGLEIEQDAPEIDTLLVAVGGGGLIGGDRRLVRRPRQGDRRRARGRADAQQGAGRGPAGRRGGRRRSRPIPWRRARSAS